ncbi:MAG: hypothetical protein HYV06_02010 [Deltaproteobacteria bacterium]|nr:hypothetical protein [Deltaproteobacteria bacterium]
MKTGSRRIIAILLLFVAITGLVVSFGEDVLCAGELPGAHGTANPSRADDTAQLHDGNCPCAPSPSNTPNDHFCAGDCGCPCHAPLAARPLLAAYSPAIVTVDFVEPFATLPEVYLSKFIPPQNPA